MQKALASNYQDKLKLVAIAAMMLDHTSAFLMPKIEVFRVIGRIAMPLFCFFAGYNFNESRKRIELLKYGSILTLISFITSGHFVTLNMLFTIYFGNLYLRKFYSPVSNFLSNLFQLLPLIILTPATMFMFEYGTMAIAFMLIGYLYKHHKYYRETYILIFSILVCMVGQIQFWFEIHNFLLLVVLAISFYYILLNSDFKLEVREDIRYITRNSLVIYFFSSVFFMIFRTIIS
jgi:hypothetical protein